MWLTYFYIFLLYYISFYLFITLWNLKTSYAFFRGITTCIYTSMSLTVIYVGDFLKHTD